MKTLVLLFALSTGALPETLSTKTMYIEKTPPPAPKISPAQKAAERTEQLKQYNEDKQDARRETRKA